MTLGPGELVSGKYRIVRLIGDGGMGSVYEARHELLGAPVALKFLHADLAQRPGLAARFLQEARVSATIQSPHVTRVTDVDTTQEGAPYLVMELLTGESLQSLLNRQGTLSQDLAVDFTLQVLAGLESAHALGVVHRDLKPDNVFVTPTGGGPLLKLIDFGIAKLRETSEYKKGLTRAGVVMGTAEYMAPEQLYAASEVDHRADLYSLGVMLFEMLSGMRPADGDSAETIIAKVLSGNVRHLADLVPNLRPGLAGLVERALASDRDQRIPSAYDMRVALAALAGELSHAGRLAAHSAPLAPIAQGAHAPLHARPPAHPEVQPPRLSNTALPQQDAGKVPDTVDAPVLGVPKTLPPDDGPVARGATQAAVPGGPLGPVPLGRSIGPTPPLATRGRRRGTRLWVVALGSLLVIAAAGVVVAQMMGRERRSLSPVSPPLFEQPDATTTIEPIVIPTPTDLPNVPNTPDVPDRRNPSTTTPRPKPTGAGGAPTFQPLPFPSFALPSTLPPLPSTFPALPTALPSFFPEIPGLTPPRAAPLTDGGAPGP